MRRKTLSLWLVALVLLLTASGCGRSEGDVLEDLKALKENLKHYKSTAEMKVRVPNVEQVYRIETWFQEPNFYRIQLADAQGRVQQVVIRNEQGVHIVSPQLKKSFRFNGDWAENQGHLYLFGPVIDRILESPDRTFTREEGTVVFQLVARPENPLVHRQRIALDARTLYPREIVLFDRDGKELVTVEFEQFDPGARFKPEDFDPQRVLAEGPKERPAWTSGSRFGVIEPAWLPEGWKRVDIREEGGTVVLRYQGQQGALALTEKRPESLQAVLPVSGKLWDLLGVPAVVTEGHAKTMYWMHNGVEFTMTASLPVEDMARIAVSTLGEAGK